MESSSNMYEMAELPTFNNPGLLNVSKCCQSDKQKISKYRGNRYMSR